MRWSRLDDQIFVSNNISLPLTIAGLETGSLVHYN